LTAALRPTGLAAADLQGMNSGAKSKKSPHQGKENDDDEACSHTHASDYSIWVFQAERKKTGHWEFP
jgi:hypothetical protein